MCDADIICDIPSDIAYTGILYKTGKDFKMVSCPFLQYNIQILEETMIDMNFSSQFRTNFISERVNLTLREILTVLIDN